MKTWVRDTTSESTTAPTGTRLGPATAEEIQCSSYLKGACHQKYNARHTDLADLPETTEVSRMQKGKPKLILI